MSDFERCRDCPGMDGDEVARLRDENARLRLNLAAHTQHEERLRLTLRFLVKHVAEVERTSVIRESDIYTNARALAQETP